MLPGPYVSLINIGSVTAKILLAKRLYGGGWVVVKGSHKSNFLKQAKFESWDLKRANIETL